MIWLIFQKNLHQCLSEVGAHEQEPPLGGDVVGTLPSEAFKDVCDGGDLIDREGHLWYVEDNEDIDGYHHDLGQLYL